ncbi:MAG: hypothetical protein ACREE6_12625 [Limisphaerales bacterium]
MSAQIFNTFAKAISDLPAEAVMTALDLQCRMLEEDFENCRIEATDEVLSIFSFRQFARMVQEEGTMHCVKRLPPEHIEFYKETIARLVRAGLLPEATMERFEFTFAGTGSFV